MTLRSHSDSAHIARMTRDELTRLVAAGVETMTEKDALAVLANRFCTGLICQLLAEDARLNSFYTVRSRLAVHRATPLTHALKLVHYLHWNDIVRFSTDVRIHPGVRHAMDVYLISRLNKLTLGQRIASARTCSREIGKRLMTDPEPRVFSSLLNNSQVREEDLAHLVTSEKATVTQLRALADHGKWSCRYAIRRALALNPATPKAVAGSQLRFLTPQDLRVIAGTATTSVFLRRCIERLLQGANHDAASGSSADFDTMG